MTTTQTYNLQCPLPVGETGFVQLGHGSGGLMTHRLLDQLVFPLFSNDQLARKHDGALLDLNGSIAVSTDSYVVSPLLFPGGSIGDLAVNGTVNDLAMCGAKARFLSLALIIEEGLPLDILKRILNDIRRAAEAAGVSIITGDTKVVEKGKGDQLFINTTGIGLVHPQAMIDSHRVGSGDKILLSGPLARHGITIMSQRKGIDFETGLTSDTRPLSDIVHKLISRFGSAIHFLRDPTRGGLATTLNELANDCKYSLLIREEAIPVEEEVAGACEMLGLDPLFVANEGIFIAVVAPEIADEVKFTIQQEEFGQQASIIGEVSDDRASEVLLQNRYGGKRVIRMLAGEQLPRIC